MPGDRKAMLFLSYNGLLEPILASQGVPYLEGLARKGYAPILLTFEKKGSLEKTGEKGVEERRADLRGRGIEWLYLRYHKRPRIVSTLFDIAVGAFSAHRLIRSRGVKIVHVRGVTPGAIMILLDHLCGVKLLFDMRGRLAEEMAAGNLWKPESLPFRLVKMAEKYLLKRADAVTVLTRKHMRYNETLDYFAARKIPKDVIPCCVDTDRFRYRPDERVTLKRRLGVEGAFVLMYHGKTGTFYVIDHMLDFFKKMLSTRPDAVFVILTTDDTAALAERVAARGIPNEKVQIVSDPPFAEIPEYLAMADAGIFFINAHEKLGSSPIKLGEYLACGVPVIINPGVGDSEDLVRDEKAGIIVTSFTEEGYAEAIGRLLDLHNEGEACRKRCRDAACRHLALKEGIKRYTAIYKALS